MKKQQQQQSSSSQPNESSETKPESKNKKYTPYTFSDFKKIQSQSVKLGGLGPDLENIEVKKKKADREKVMEFADKQKKENFEKIQKLRIKSRIS
ncbi:MAG: hypothetical protein EZS28_046345 [Streblomastix strix]|uniref:Uncharacterized protein n=1 Tax=Streblomastix strix TaxID=222440 RepID=A0A5J4TIN9_9EUKA|nr:MAG: hypothetical protein EZS28_046345 [Streblomastix strix]